MGLLNKVSWWLAVTHRNKTEGLRTEANTSMDMFTDVQWHLSSWDLPVTPRHTEDEWANYFRESEQICEIKCAKCCQSTGMLRLKIIFRSGHLALIYISALKLTWNKGWVFNFPNSQLFELVVITMKLYFIPPFSLLFMQVVLPAKRSLSWTLSW